MPHSAIIAVIPPRMIRQIQPLSTKADAKANSESSARHCIFNQCVQCIMSHNDLADTRLATELLSLLGPSWVTIGRFLLTIFLLGSSTCSVALRCAEVALFVAGRRTNPACSATTLTACITCNTEQYKCRVISVQSAETSRSLGVDCQTARMNMQLGSSTNNLTPTQIVAELGSGNEVPVGTSKCLHWTIIEVSEHESVTRLRKDLTGSLTKDSNLQVNGRTPWI
ncbi:hypothetical protein F5Y16DRAFT_107247 [Xylariaceae sp. FL0255]|nr:hypothetical protein F5Y16DRAFT_107247 [Xylariaceae sp. FL0255]